MIDKLVNIVYIIVVKEENVFLFDCFLVNICFFFNFILKFKKLLFTAFYKNK